MSKIRVGILSFSDGRERVHESLKTYIKECEERIVKKLEDSGEVEVVLGSEIIWNNKLAKEIGVELTQKNVDACILNVAVFAFPNFTTIASGLQHVPLMAIAPINGQMPGLGGLQAATNMIHQEGRDCEKVYGNIEEQKTYNRVIAFLRASKAITQLKGQVFGLFGGRSIGMGSGAINPDLWRSLFGVDVDHMDQLEIIRRAELISDEEADTGLSWLEENVGTIHYDNDKLTKETLKMQIKTYCAIKEITKEQGYSFVGVKCHYELSEYYYAQCLAAALMNDPYDWRGKKESIVFSCEADGDAGLTMQIMKLISRKPVLFMDLRHYLEKDNVLALCNCGACATWYAGRSDNPAVNLKNVELFPLIPKYAGKGCHVQFISKAGQMTFARLVRNQTKYKLQAFMGNAKELPKEKLKETCPSWPHTFTEVSSDPYDLIDSYENNHVHAVEGNYMEELKIFCKLKNIIFEEL
jgi:L-fucose isomerase